MSDNPFASADNESGFVVNDNVNFASEQGNVPPTQPTNFANEDSNTKDEEKVEKKKKYKWYHFYKAEFYSKFFDVETTDVLKRLFWGLIPLFGDFFEQVGENPDLYGPLWISASIIIFSFFAGSLAASLTSEYNFKRLTILAGAVLVYVLFIPIILWAVCRFAFKVKKTPTAFYCFLGYSITIYVLVIPLCAIPLWYVQIPLVVIGLILSTLVQLKHLFFLLKEQGKILYVIITLAVMLVINLILACVLAYAVWP